MEETLTTLAARYHLLLTPAGSGWHLRLPQRGALQCKLTVGPETLEWHAALSNSADDREVWTDWMDYEGYDQSPPEKLLSDKELDLAWFVDQWCTAVGTRHSVQSSMMGLRKVVTVEWDHDGFWQGIQLHSPNR